MTLTHWTDERVTQMRAMALKGLSATEIGRALKCSRNAVLGKLHRLDVAAGKVVKPRGPLRAERRSSVSPAAATLCLKAIPGVAMLRPLPLSRRKPAELVPGEACGILNVTGCKWPVGESEAVIGSHLFCNAEKAHGRSYCAHHQFVGTRDLPAQRERAG